MNVLQILDRFQGDAIGGMQVVVESTSLELSARGHHVTVLADLGEALYRQTRLKDGVVHVDRSLRVKPRDYFFDGRAIARRLDADAPYDIVHSHFALASLGPRSVLWRAPSIRTYHGSWDLEAAIDSRGAEKSATDPSVRLGLAARFVIDLFDLRGSEAVVALSDFSIEQLTRRFRIPRSKITKVAGGVDTERFAPTMRKTEYRNLLNVPSSGALVFAAGRLVRRKAFDRLIAAMAIVTRSIPNAILAIAGEGPERAQLEEQITELGLVGRVRLLGALTGSIADYYRAADLFVLPSRALETFGLVTIEALASGTIAVGTPSGATPEILRDLDERLVSRDGSAEALADAILGVLKGNWSGTFTPERLISHVRERYSWSAHVDVLEDIYRRVARKRR